MIGYTHNSDLANDGQTGVWNQLAGDFGMEIDGIGTVKYLKRCFFRKGPGVHMVMSGKKGAVDVLIMEGEYVPVRVDGGNDSMDWVLLPCPVGSMAIIGKKNEALDRIERLLRRAIHWQNTH